MGGSSAYSKVTFETCTRLARVGYQMAHIPMGRSNLLGKNVYHGVLLYPSGDEPFCEDVALQHYIDFKADMLITLKEPWIFNRVFAYPINYVPICPIDHSPVSNFITSRLQTAFKVVSISRFGQMELKKQGIDSEFIPHGVSEVYRPLEDKVACRKMFFLEEDDFVVGIVAMNRARKMIPQMLRGYKRFLEINRDVKSHLLLWTSVVPDVRPEDALSIGVQDVGVNLIPEIAELGLAIPPNDVRWFKPQEWAKLMSMGGLPEWDSSGGWDMVKLFNAMDCLLLCSGGEGAGLTLLEAAACGVTGITTDYAAGPEYVGPGLVVPWKDYVVYDTPGTRRVLADVDAMAEALTKIYNADREKFAKKAVRFAERYRWNNIIETYWKTFLNKCTEELYPLVSAEGTTSWV